MMTYKEFKDWLTDVKIDAFTNENMVRCTIALSEMEQKPKEEQEYYWRHNYEYLITKTIVEPVDAKINGEEKHTVELTDGDIYLIREAFYEYRNSTDKRMQYHREGSEARIKLAVLIEEIDKLDEYMKDCMEEQK